MRIFNKEERIKYVGFNDMWFLAIGIPLLALFVPIAFFQIYPRGESSQFFILAYIESLIHAFSYWFCFRNFAVFLRKKFQGFEYTRKRIIYEIIFVLMTGVLVSELVGTCLLVLTGSVKEVTLIEGYVATYFSSFFVISIYEGIYLYDQNKKTLLKSEKLKREHINSELQALRNQVNPHFLFNSLNTLVSIIPEDQKLAESFLIKLSSVYRYTLENRNDQLVPLKQELKFIESYIFLLKERFRNKLKVDIEIADHWLHRYVVPMSLQLLFENVIKHNVLSSKKPLLIKVYIDEEECLVVRNNLQLKNQTMPSTGVGLKNINSRIGFFTDKKLIVNSRASYFEVRMPLIEDYNRE